MRKRLFFYALTGVLLLLSSCRSHYQMTGVERSRIVVDSRYDRQPDEAAVRYLAPYKHQVDSVMGPVMGQVAHNMHAARPESDLSNLLSDVMVWAAKAYHEQEAEAEDDDGGMALHEGHQGPRSHEHVGDGRDDGHLPGQRSGKEQCLQGSRPPFKR